MTVQRAPTPLPPGTSACIGAFDGLHLGHQALLRKALALAPRLALVTFEPHPSVVLGRFPDRRRLTNPAQRERLARALGVDTLVLLPFDHAVASLEPGEFVQRDLIDGLRPAAVVVGSDFRYGRDRKGHASDLLEQLARVDIPCEIVPKIAAPQGSGFDELSSTNIRRALEAGQVEAAASMLGRWHSAAGTVVRGAGRGRAIGYPTANIAAPDAFLPRSGIYVAALSLWDPTSFGGNTVWPAVASLGTNPTFTPENPELVLEVHVLDRDLGESLYGAEVEVAFIHRLRDEMAFATVPELIRQIEADIRAARPLLTASNLAMVSIPRDTK